MIRICSPNIFINMMERILLLLFAMAACILDCHTSGPTHGKIVVCYLGTWSIYQEDYAKYELKDMDPSLCTHVVYAFAGLDEETMSIKSLDPDLDKYGKFENSGYQGFAALKSDYPHLKILVSIGGWNEGSLKFSQMAASADTRTEFIQSVLEFIYVYKFDGIDMHWKYPVLRDGRAEDKSNFVTLMKELYEALKPWGYILTTAIGATKYIIDDAYDLPQLNRYVDFINVLAFDYHGSWDGVVGINAPLKGLHKDDVYSVEYTIKYMLSNGVSSKKIVVGLPLFGRTFILEKPNTKDIEFGRTLAKSESFGGPYTKDLGFLAYHEICMETSLNSSKWSDHWHDQSSTPYLRNGDRVITYDNARSLAIKVKKVVEYDLAGVMLWSIDADDFKGLCDKDLDDVSLSFTALQNFVDTINRISRNPILQNILQNNNLADAQQLDTLSKSSEVAHKNLLWTAESGLRSYPLMRAIDESLTLAQTEKMVISDMISMMNDEPKVIPTSVTNTSLPTVVCYFCFV